MVQSSPTAGEPADSGATQKRPSDSAVRIARLQATLDGLQDSFGRALDRLNANANRQDELIASATVALTEAKRILEECHGLSQRIDNIEKRDSLTGVVIKAAMLMPWWRLVLMAGVVVAVLMLLKRLGLF